MIRAEQDQIIAEWAIRFVQNQRDALRQVKAEASKGLINDFKVKEQARATSQLISSVVFELRKYGRYLDMKKVNRQNQLPVQELEEWIREKGVAKFERKFKRHNPGSKSTGNKLINQIAWGIVKGKQKRNKHRRKKWYNKVKDYQISQLFDDLADLYREHGIRSAKEAFKIK